MPIAPQNKPQNLAIVERNGNKLELAQTGSKFMPIAAENKPQNLAVVERNGNKLELAQTSSGFMPIAPQNKPQNLAIVERNGNKLELAQTSDPLIHPDTGLAITTTGYHWYGQEPLALAQT